MNAKAKAQAVEALQQAAIALKRNIGVNRRALQAVKQAEVGLLGIEIHTVEGDEVGCQHQEYRD